MILPFLLVVSLASPTAEAAPTWLATASDNQGWVDFAWDPTWVLEGGWSHHLSPALRLEVDVAAPIVLVPDLGGLSGETGLSSRFTVRGGWGVEVGLNTGLALARDSLGDKLGWNADLRLRPGWAAERWSAGLDLGFRPTLATRFWPGEPVQDLFGDRPGSEIQSPWDGWVRFTGQRLRAGAAGTLALGNHGVFALSGGFEWTPQAQGLLANPQLGQLPFTVHALGGWRW